MSKKIIPIILLLTLIIGCQDQEITNYDRPGDPLRRVGNTHNVMSMPDFQVVSAETAYNTLTNFNNVIRSNPNAIIDRSQGFESTEFTNIWIPSGMSYMRDMHLVNNGEEDLPYYSKEQRRNDIAALLPRMGMSENFNATILNALDWMMNLQYRDDWEVLAQLDIYISYASYAYGLNEHERFALVQMFTNLKNVIREAIDNPPAIANGRNPGDCNPNLDMWKEVAWEALVFGSEVGAAVGIVGYRIGASITAAAGGNPVWGGIAGGIIGFTAGFAAGAVGGGGSRLIYECLWQKAVLRKTKHDSYYCDGTKIYMSQKAIAQCMQLNMTYPTEIVDWTTRRGMMQIQSMHLFANNSQTKIDEIVERDIKFITQRL